MTSFRKILSIVLFITIILMLMVNLKKNHSEKDSQHLKNDIVKENSKNSQSNSGQMVISKQAIDDLVNKAAQQKYLQDVLGGEEKLPVPKSTAVPVPLQALNTHEISKGQNTIQSQRCFYNGQSFVAGDIVKTDQGWIRCAPTFIFSEDKPTVSNRGVPAWTAVQ